MPTVIDTLLGDLPHVHKSAPGGLWLTDRDCYEFIAAHCGRQARTLETGLGLSTVLFARLGTEHTCVVPYQEEVDACVRYLDERGIDRGRLSFHVGWSDEILPRLKPTPLDLVFVDGSHAWPCQVIDWFYAGSRLEAGGVLVVDDVQLPAVADAFVGFLDRDPRWLRLERTGKWCAYQRQTSGPLREEWTDQHDRGMFAWHKPPLATRARRRLRRELARLVPRRSSEP